jgi:hypothetical protein
MDKISLWKKIIKYAKSPVSPMSCGFLAIINGVFSPFAYVPLSSFSGRMLSESIESISLFNRWSGMVILLLSFISFGLLIKKKYLSSLIPAILSAVIVIIEAYKVIVIGVTGTQYGSLSNPEMFSPRGLVVVYDLTVRARLGNALGFLTGGHIAFFFAVLMRRNQSNKEKKSPCAKL